MHTNLETLKYLRILFTFNLQCLQVTLFIWFDKSIKKTRVYKYSIVDVIYFY